MAKAHVNPERYALNYTVDLDLSNGARLASFLNQAANDMPLTFFKKPHLIRIAFGMKVLPRLNCLEMKRWGYVIKAAETILEREYNKTVFSDRVEGYRATTNDADRAKTKLRQQSARLVTQHAKVQKTASALDVRNISDPALREEVINAKRALTMIGSSLLQLPQLPAKPSATK